MTAGMMVSITKAGLYGIPSIPPNDIAQRLDHLSVETQHLESLYQQILDDLDDLKQSILEKAFRGELTQAEEAA